MAMNAEMAETAAKWWADRLREGAKLDNADPSSAGGMAFLMGKTLQASMAGKRTPEQVDLFEKILYERLLDFTGRWIGVDYHPIGVFVESAEAAGFELSMSCLPWKTNMYFDDGVVKVSYGYGAEMRALS